VDALGTRHASLAIPVAYMVLRGLHRTYDPQIAAAAISDYVTALVAGTTYEQLADTPELAGYRQLHALRGKTGRQFLPSPESLFKLLFKRANWRSFDPIVDAYTLVSLQTRVSIGAHDLACLRLPVTLAPTVGGESLLTIGDTTPVTLSAGEYCYRDADGQLLGRMECRQAEATKVTAATRDVLFIVQGHAALGARELHAASLLLGQTLTELVGFADAIEGPLVIE